MLRLKIISPERTIFDGEVVRVVVPGTMGMFEILEHHAPIISSLTAGVQKDEVRLCVELS